jgi:hypothetical protein
VTVEYVELVDYLAIAAEVTGFDPATLTRVAKVNLADSALHAPAAGFGEPDLYPDFVDKAAVLVVRLAKNHPLPVAAALLDPWPLPQSDGERDVSRQDVVAQLAAELHARDASW